SRYNQLKIPVLQRPIEPTQYTSIRYTERLELEEIAPSIGSVGDAFDNALMESINGLYKTECIRTTVFHSGPYKTVSDVEFATAGWVDWYDCETFSGWSGTGWQDGDWLFHPAGVTLGTTDFNVFSVDLSVCGGG